MKPYCHMGEMCLGCSPQLIEGICPDSRAGRIVAELVETLKEVFADHDAVNRLSWNARLIAAAPCMAEALQALIACDFGAGGWDAAAEQAATKARAAIAKATGGKG